MGLYLNVPGKENATEMWLNENGDYLFCNEEQKHDYSDKENIIVCLVDNVKFCAAAVLFNQEEAKRFICPDGRIKFFYRVPLKNLKEVISEDILASYGLIEKTKAR